MSGGTRALDQTAVGGDERTIEHLGESDVSGVVVGESAKRGELQRRFVRHGLVLAGIGVVIGLVAAAGLTRLLSTLLYGITPLDPVTYVSVPLVLVVATLLASYLPARRAASVDPVEALRME